MYRLAVASDIDRRDVLTSMGYQLKKPAKPRRATCLHLERPLWIGLDDHRSRKRHRRMRPTRTALPSGSVSACAARPACPEPVAPSLAISPSRLEAEP